MVLCIGVVAYRNERGVIMNDEKEVCQRAVEWQDSLLSESKFDELIMKAIERADSGNLNKIWKVFPVHVEAFLRVNNMHDNPFVKFEDSPTWYKETEDAYWKDQDMKEQSERDRNLINDCLMVNVIRGFTV